MKKLIKAIVIGYAVLWGADEIKARRPQREIEPKPRPRFKSMTSN